MLVEGSRQLLKGLRTADDSRRVNAWIGLSGLRIVGLVVALAVVAMLWRTGLPFQGTSKSSTGLLAEASPSSGDAAQANVRGAVPAVEAFYAEHGTYDGLGDPLHGIARL